MTGKYGLMRGYFGGSVKVVVIERETEKTFSGFEIDERGKRYFNVRRGRKNDLLGRVETEELAREVCANVASAWKAHSETVASAMAALSAANAARDDAFRAALSQALGEGQP